MAQELTTLTPNVREASFDDIPHIVELGREFHSKSGWSSEPFSDYVFTITCQNLITAPHAVLLYNRYGMLGGMRMQTYFGGTPFAQELFWYARRGGRDLMRAFEDWTRSQGMEKIVAGAVTLDGNRDAYMDELYRRRGWRQIERHYTKDV